MSNPPVPTTTTTSTPRSGDRGIAANTHKGHVAGFEGAPTQCERAWLRKLELQYVTAADGQARGIVVAESLFVAPTLRCSWLAQRLQHVEGDVEQTPSKPHDMVGGPSTARLLARPGPATPPTHPPASASGQSKPRLAGRKKVGKRRKR